MNKELSLRKNKYNIVTEDFTSNGIKKHKAFGALKKYANPSIIGHEREIVGEAIAEKYIKNNRC